MKKSLYWPVGLIVFISLFLIANIATLIYLSTQRIDLVTDHYYEKSIKYQDQIERIERTNALSAPIRISHNNPGNRLFIHFPKEFLGKTTGGTITLYRPSDALMDRSFPIAIGDSGTQVIETPGLARGLWRVKISWKADSLEYYQEEAVVF